MIAVQQHRMIRMHHESFGLICCSPHVRYSADLIVNPNCRESFVFLMVERGASVTREVAGLTVDLQGAATKLAVIRMRYTVRVIST
jgi:hypothetical protein